MARNARESIESRNAALNARARLLDGGFLRLYTGTQPASPDTAVSTQTLLSTHALAGTSAPAASAGVLTFSAIGDDTSADATGTPTWGRFFKADGVTAVVDGSAGIASDNANITLNAVPIQQGARVSVTSATFGQPLQGS